MLPKLLPKNEPNSLSGKITTSRLVPKRKYTKRFLRKFYYSLLIKVHIYILKWVQFASWSTGSVPSSHARGLGFETHWGKYILFISWILNNLHYINSALKKTARPAQVREKIEMLVPQ